MQLGAFSVLIPTRTTPAAALTHPHHPDAGSGYSGPTAVTSHQALTVLDRDREFRWSSMPEAATSRVSSSWLSRSSRSESQPPMCRSTGGASTQLTRRTDVAPRDYRGCRFPGATGRCWLRSAGRDRAGVPFGPWDRAHPDPESGARCKRRGFHGFGGGRGLELGVAGGVGGKNLR